MLKGAVLPPWLAEFSRSYNGVTAPAEFVTVKGRHYEIFPLCKPHDCGDNKFEVMFERGGGRARGLLVTPDAKTFFGDPSESEKAELVRAAEK